MIRFAIIEQKSLFREISLLSSVSFQIKYRVGPQLHFVKGFAHYLTLIYSDRLIIFCFTWNLILNTPAHTHSCINAHKIMKNLGVFTRANLSRQLREKKDICINLFVIIRKHSEGTDL